MNESEEESHTWPWTVLVIILVILLVVGAVVIFNYITQTKPKNYYETAPNGYYTVIPYDPDIPQEPNCVYFPMSETSGSELHGKWKVKEGLNFPCIFDVWYRVRLENNVIVEAEMKGHMSL